jgi:hypothetical protein
MKKSRSSNRLRRLSTALSLVLALAAACWTAGSSPRPARAYSRDAPRQADHTPYLELSIQPSMAKVGDLLTLQITVHNIGMPWMYISISPCENVAYDPPISETCRIPEALPGQTTITYRALKTGVVTFHAYASGEIFDDGCQCLVWFGGSDNGPAIAGIVDAIWKTFLPVLQR